MTDTKTGVAQQLRDSPIDIAVVAGKGDDVFLKADRQVLLLDETELRLVGEEIDEFLREVED